MQPMWVNRFEAIPSFSHGWRGTSQYAPTPCCHEKGNIRVWIMLSLSQHWDNWNFMSHYELNVSNIGSVWESKVLGLHFYEFISPTKWRMIIEIVERVLDIDVTVSALQLLLLTILAKTVKNIPLEITFWRKSYCPLPYTRCTLPCVPEWDGFLWLGTCSGQSGWSIWPQAMGFAKTFMAEKRISTIYKGKGVKKPLSLMVFYFSLLGLASSSFALGIIFHPWWECNQASLRLFYKILFSSWVSQMSSRPGYFIWVNQRHMLFLLLHIDTMNGPTFTLRGFNYELIMLCTCTGQLHTATSATHVPATIESLVAQTMCYIHVS